MLVRAGEFTSSRNLQNSRLAEIKRMCHPPKFGWDSFEGKEKLNTKNTNTCPERRAKMELAAKTDKNKPEKMLYEQAISLRKQLLVDKIMKSGYRLKHLSGRFKNDYDRGKSLVSLSQKYVSKKNTENNERKKLPYFCQQLTGSFYSISNYLNFFSMILVCLVL